MAALEEGLGSVFSVYLAAQNYLQLQGTRAPGMLGIQVIHRCALKHSNIHKPCFKM